MKIEISITPKEMADFLRELENQPTDEIETLDLNGVSQSLQSALANTLKRNS